MIENIKDLDEKSVAGKQYKAHRFNVQTDDPLSASNYNPCVTFNIDDINRFKDFQENEAITEGEKTISQQIKVNLFKDFNAVSKSTRNINTLLKTNPD